MTKRSARQLELSNTRENEFTSRNFWRPISEDVASVSKCRTRSQHGTGSNVNEIRGKAVWKRATCVYKSSSGYITNCRMQFGLQNFQNFMTSSDMIVWLGMSVSPLLLHASTLSPAGEKLLCFQAATVVFFLK